MITLNVSFLLGINLIDQTRSKINKKNKKSKKTPKKKKSAKDSSSKSSKKSKSTKKSQKSTTTTVIHEKNVFEKCAGNEAVSVFYIGDPVASFRIEYELLPNFTYFIDVICWGAVVKVISSDGSKCFTTAIEGNIAWIPICVQHFLQPLSDEHLENLFKHLIKCQIVVTKNKSESRAKIGKAEACFYILTENLESKQFEEVFNEYPSTETDDISIEKYISNLLEFCIKFAVQSSVSCVTDFYKGHLTRINQVLSQIKTEKDVCCNSTHFGFNADQIKMSKNKVKKNAIMAISVPGQMLLTDSHLSTFRMEQEQFYHRISHGFVLFSSKNLLTNRQKFDFAPLVVKLQRIDNLPYKLLQDNGYKNIYLHCKIPDIADFQTLSQPVGRRVCFNESNLILVNKTPHIKILNILQNSNVVVEICGFKEIPSQSKLDLRKKDSKKLKTKGKKAGSKKSSSKRSKSKKSKSKKKAKNLELVAKSEPVVLGVAVFELNSLLHSYWLFKEKGPVYNPKKFISTLPPLLEIFSDRFTINEINLVLDPIMANKSPLLNEILILNNTTIKFEAAFMTTQYPHFYIQNAKRTFTRVMLIVFKEAFAKSIINEILTYNKSIMGGVILFSMNLLTKKCFRDIENALSGYMVDDGSNYIFYIEGPSNGHILSIIHRLSGVNLNIAKVFYNSNSVFADRIFQNYPLWNGFFFVTLKMPLRVIFSKQLLYVQGNVPIPCWKALQKLNLTVHSNLFNMVLHDDLIIGEIEILSLSFEWGLQLKYKSVLKTPSQNYFVSTTDLFSKKH